MGLNVALIGETFTRAKNENGGARALGLRFYERLFEKYPAVKPLFKTPPEEQHKKLMASLGAIVATVTEPSKMLPYLHAMGVRHLDYGTENGHYAAVAENLIAVLGEHLSKEGTWTDEMASAWNEALTAIAGIMIAAADHPEQFSEEMMQAGYNAKGYRSDSVPDWELPAA